MHRFIDTYAKHKGSVVSSGWREEEVMEVTKCTAIYCAALNMKNKVNSSPSWCCHNHPLVFQRKAGKWFIREMLSTLWEYINTSIDHRGSTIKTYKNISNTDVLKKGKIHLRNNNILAYSFDAQRANIQYLSTMGHKRYVLRDSIFCGHHFQIFAKRLYVEWKA